MTREQMARVACALQRLEHFRRDARALVEEFIKERGTDGYGQGNAHLHCMDSAVALQEALERELLRAAVAEGVVPEPDYVEIRGKLERCPMPEEAKLVIAHALKLERDDADAIRAGNFVSLLPPGFRDAVNAWRQTGRSL